jgi:hypothetical protein
MPEPAKPQKKSTVALLFSLFLEKCGKLSRKTIIILLAAVLVPVLVFFAVREAFLYRSPLVVVSDASFMTLYGPTRLKKMENRLSSRLFRRVITVYVDENAGSDQVSFAAEDASEKPLAVLFPHRYMGAGDYYKENHPDTPVYIASGRNQTSKAKGAVSFIRTDIKTDLYRAGLCAAMLAGEGSILFISDEVVPSENREAFIEGLRARDYTKNPTWGRYSSDFLSDSDLSCAVIAGPVGDFFAQRPDTPVILFSWADPDFTPRSVKVIFDDSPYALAFREPKLFSSAGVEGAILVSSVPTVFKDRLKERKGGNKEDEETEEMEEVKKVVVDFKKLESLLKEKYQKEEDQNK